MTETGIPQPIVTVNRALIVSTVVLAIALQQPALLAALFVVLLPGALLGRRASPIYQIGTRVLTRSGWTGEHEDVRMQRFNNILAVVLLGASLIAFALGASVAGWAFALAVAAAATVALLGFCIGCFLFLQLRLGQHRVAKWLS
jgi:Domain of unknown function (DUF4395)